MDYVTGYVLSEDLKKVLLIRKNRPPEQAGKLNGICGKIEEGDISPLFALLREFKKETGVDTYQEQWKKLDGVRKNGTFLLHIFYMVNDKVLNAARTVETEEVGIYRVINLELEETMNTVRFLIEKAIFLAQHENMEVI